MPSKTISRTTYSRKAPKRNKYGAKKVIYRSKYMKDSSITRPPTLKSDAGFINTYIPAFSRTRYWGKVRFGAAAINLSSNVGQVGTYVYTANGLFDPSITGGSLQPAGFSQLMSAYEHYTVWRARISVLFTNNSASTAIVGISIEPDPTAATDTSNMLELPNTQVVNLEPSGQYGSSKTISLMCSLSKYFGESVTKTTSIYRGDVANNPTEQAYFHVKTYGFKQDTSNVYMQVRIDYEALFTEPRELSPSLSHGIMDLILDEKKDKLEPEPVTAPPIIVPDYTPRQRR
uniref:Capsid protein n=1 Tax=Red panda feces-associated circular DNA virus 9 TaxID=2863984 RepID=A0A8K1HHR7_9VIRU|nr:capsid protein [Red panda feces-associated circular DNA virus 9]